MKIRNKLFIVLFVIVLIPVLVISLILNRKAEDYIKADKLIYLNSTADAKLNAIEELIYDFKHDLIILQSAYTIKSSLPLVSKYIDDRANPLYIKGEGILSSGVLNAYTQRAYIREVFLMDAEGRVCYKTNDKEKLLQLGQKPDFFSEKNLLLWRKEIWVSDAVNYKENSSIFFVAPEFDSAKDLIGFIAFNVDMKAFYDLLRERHGLGHTGEAYFGKMDGNYIVYTSPLLYKTEEKTPLRISLSNDNAQHLPMAQALNGVDGSGLTEDYRGVSVIASWRHIPSNKWGLAVKIDQSEAFADIYIFRIYIILLTIFIIVVTFFVSRWISKSISVPIVALNKATKVISTGNFEQKINIKSKGEIGELANSFDQMTTKLKKITVSRDELNKEVLERKKSEAIVSSLLNEKEYLMKEIQHRIKNHMAAVIGILDLHAATLHESDSKAINILLDTASRIRSMCILYDKLYRSQSLTSVSIKSYLESLADQLLSNFPNSSKVKLKKEIEDFMISAQISFALGIIINEILTNTMKYAFEGREAGNITVIALKRGDKAVIAIHDDGIGIPEDFNIAKSAGFGMSLIKMLTEQIGGTIDIQSSNGTKTTIIFPV